MGYRYFDTAPGKDEEEVGEAVTAKIKEGVVKRYTCEVLFAEFLLF